MMNLASEYNYMHSTVHIIEGVTEAAKSSHKGPNILAGAVELHRWWIPLRLCVLQCPG